ncbi:MAG: hypothetical protein KDD70_03935, partial [Bdellovibrionales bacterium]|nr:hypothetical protein [Bdellovibrionales bacterium]
VGPPVPGAPPEADLCANGATEVLRYVVGTGANGNPVDSSRQDTAKALGVPERNDTDNFVSLGRGGLIELGFSGRAIWNKEGFDLEIVETSWGHRGRPCSTYPEYVEAYATADVSSWHTLGVICRDGKLQLDLAGLPYATAIRLEDRTTMEASDGFDVDGIGCIASSTSAAVPSGSPEDGDNGLRAAFTSGSSSEVTAANVALCTGEGTTLIVTEDAAPEYFLKGATEGRCEESLQSFTRAAMDASTVEMCFKITNKNPADYETLGWKFSWQASATKLETVGPNSEVIVCTNVNPQPTFELYENGKLQSSVTHPLKECKRTLGKFVASVALFGTNGDPLTTRQLSTFEDLDMYFEAKNLQSNERTLLRLEEPYLGSIELAEGDYKFSLIAPGATITSKPKSFRMKGIETDTLFRWAIRGKGARVKKGRKGRSGR